MFLLLLKGNGVKMSPKVKRRPTMKLTHTFLRTSAYASTEQNHAYTSLGNRESQLIPSHMTGTILSIVTDQSCPEEVFHNLCYLLIFLTRVNIEPSVFTKCAHGVCTNLDHPNTV